MQLGLLEPLCRASSPPLYDLISLRKHQCLLSELSPNPNTDYSSRTPPRDERGKPELSGGLVSTGSGAALGTAESNVDTCASVTKRVHGTGQDKGGPVGMLSGRCHPQL